MNKLEAARPAFQAADAALRNLYTAAWRNSATLAARFSQPTYRAAALLRLHGLYYAASQKVYENAQQYLSGLESARGSEDCASASAEIIGPLATPQKYLRLVSRLPRPLCLLGAGAWPLAVIVPTLFSPTHSGWIATRS